MKQFSTLTLPWTVQMVSCTGLDVPKRGAATNVSGRGEPKVLKPTEPLPLHHSWPLFERERRFELGYVFCRAPAGLNLSAASSMDENELARCGIGFWECDLSDDTLTWSAAVYDIFGLPRDTLVPRGEAVALYAEDSRIAMERLRAYAIKHHRGFTLDAEIRPALGRPRWMRLIAAPICEGDRVVRLRGLKLII